MECRGLTLMRVDLRGLLAVIGQVQTAFRQAFGEGSAPSPEAWSSSVRAPR
jgi:hypothetical protein